MQASKQTPPLINSSTPLPRNLSPSSPSSIAAARLCGRDGAGGRAIGRRRSAVDGGDGGSTCVTEGNAMTDIVVEKGIEKGKQLMLTASTSPVRPKEAGDIANYNTYPEPMAKYDDVITDRELFLKTLESLHATLGTKFMVPTIGGKELDLHRLFTEVTSRGGIEKVIRDRRWKEITAVFSFPSTATNASFVLRKYYMSLIHHYEQIYFFEAKGWITPSEKTSEHVVNLENHGTVQKRRRSISDTRGNMHLPANFPVVGVIDGKFEHGYLVTVMVGTEKLKGILYHTSGYQVAPVQQIEFGNSSAMGGGRRRRRRKKLSTLDPTHPKPNRSGYNFFFAEQHGRLKPLYPGKDREISKIIGDLWNKLTESEKAVYQERGLKDKERYRSEMVLYRERQKTGHLICNAFPIRQQPVGLEAKKSAMNVETKKEEAALPMTPENESSTTGSDTERKLNNDSDLDNCTEVDFHAESANPESFTDSDGFELRRRDMENADEVSGPTKNVDVVVGEFTGPSKVIVDGDQPRAAGDE